MILVQGAVQDASFCVGEPCGRAFGERVAFALDRVAHRFRLLGEVEADEAGVVVVASAREQAGRFHPGCRLHDRWRGDMEALGELAGSQTVCLPKCLEHEVLPDADAVSAHRLVGGLAHQLRRPREQAEEFIHGGA